MNFRDGLTGLLRELWKRLPDIAVMAGAGAGLLLVLWVMFMLNAPD